MAIFAIFKAWAGVRQDATLGASLAPRVAVLETAVATTTAVNAERFRSIDEKLDRLLDAAERR